MGLRKLRLSKEELQELYIKQNLSATAIAKMHNVCEGTIRYTLVFFGISRQGSKATGPKHGNWKGGRRATSGGYIGIWLDKDSPFAPMRNHHCQVLEHRLVMAQYLGRCLQPWEIVHHKNGIRDDNHFENLELFPVNIEHLPSMIMQYKIKELEKQLKLLKWQVRHLNSEVKTLTDALQLKLRQDIKELEKQYVNVPALDSP